MKKITAFILILAMTLLLSFGIVMAADDPDPNVIKNGTQIAADDPDPNGWKPPVIPM